MQTGAAKSSIGSGGFLGLFRWSVVQQSLFLDEEFCCEVTAVNSVIRQTAGGSVRHQLSHQTLALHHAGISDRWMLDPVPFL